MAWTLPVTIDDTTYPLHFDTDEKPSQEDIDWSVNELAKAHSGQLSSLGVRTPSGRILQPESPVGSFAREAATQVLPSLATAGGALAAGAALGPETAGVGALPAAYTAGVGAAALTQAVQNESLRSHMGNEAFERMQEQRAVNQMANPMASKMGGFLGQAPAMIGGGGGLNKVVSGTAGNVLESAGAGAIMTGAGAAQRAISGEGHWADLPEETVKGMVTMGPLGFIPHAQTILGSVLGKAPADAAAIALSNQLYDYAVHGKPIDPKAFAAQTGEDIPGFMLLNAVTAFMHGHAAADNPLVKLGQNTAEEVRDISPEAAASVQQTTDRLASKLDAQGNVIAPPPKETAKPAEAPPVEPAIEPPTTQENATPAGNEPSDQIEQHQGIPPREDLPTDENDVRESARGPSGSSRGDVEGEGEQVAPAPAIPSRPSSAPRPPEPLYKGPTIGEYEDVLSKKHGIPLGEKTTPGSHMTDDLWNAMSETEQDYHSRIEQREIQRKQAEKDLERAKAYRAARESAEKPTGAPKSVELPKGVTVEHAGGETLDPDKGPEASTVKMVRDGKTIGSVNFRQEHASIYDEITKGAPTYRIGGINIDSNEQGQGLGQRLYLETLARHPDGWFWNSQTKLPAGHALRSLEKKGLIELHEERPPGKDRDLAEKVEQDIGGNIKRITEKGLRAIGKEPEPLVRPATEGAGEKIPAKEPTIEDLRAWHGEQKGDGTFKSIADTWGRYQKFIEDQGGTPDRAKFEDLLRSNGEHARWWRPKTEAKPEPAQAPEPKPEGQKDVRATAKEGIRRKERIDELQSQIGELQAERDYSEEVGDHETIKRVDRDLEAAHDKLNALQPKEEPAKADLTAGRPPIPKETTKQKLENDKASVDQLNKTYADRKQPIKIKLAKPSLSLEQKTLVDEFQRIYNRRIVFFKPERGSFQPDGLFHESQPNALFINVDSALDPVGLVSHELMHSLKVTHPELYRDLMKVMEPLMDAEGYKQKLTDTYARRGLKAPNLDLAKEELVSDFAADRILNPEFLQKLHDSDPTLFQKVAEVLRKWVREAIAQFGKVYRDTVTLKGAKWLSDVEKAENALVRLMREAAKSAGEGAGGTEGKFSIDPNREEGEESPEEGIARTKADLQAQNEEFGRPLNPESIPVEIRPEFEKANSLLAAHPKAGEELVNKLLESPRQVSRQESALLSNYLVRLDNGMRENSRIMDDPHSTPEENVEAMVRFGTMSRELDRFHDASLAAGTEWGRVGRWMQQKLKEDYSLANMLRRAKATNGGKDLTEKQAEEIRQLHAKLEAQEKTMADQQKEHADFVAAQLQKDEATTPKGQDWWEEAKATLTPERRKQAEALEAELKNYQDIKSDIDQIQAQLDTMSQAAAPDSGAKFSIDPAEFKGKTREELEAMLAERKAKLVPSEAKLDSLFKGMAKGASPKVKKAVEKANGFRAKKGQPVDIAKVEKSLEAFKDKPITDIPHSLLEQIARYHIQKGVKDVEDLQAKMLETLKPIFGDVDPRDLRAALTKYGQVKFPNPEAVAKQLRDYKQQMLLLEKLSDVVNNQLPKATGLRRDKLTARARELHKELLQQMRERNLQPSDDPTRLAAAKQSILSRLNNEIEELTRVIEGKAKPRGENTPVEHTDEMKALAKHRDELKAYVKDLTGPSPEHEWNEKAQKAAARMEQLYADRIKNLDFEAKKKQTPEATQATKDAKKAALAKREEWTELRDKLHPEIMDAKRLDQYKSAIERSETEYRRKINESDFTKRQKTETKLDQEAQEALIARERTKQEFRNLERKNQLANRSNWQKTIDAAVGYKRFGVLTSPAIFGKLTAASLARVGSTGVQDLAGSGWRKALPQLAAKAEVEGGGFSAKETAEAIVKARAKGMKDAADTIRTGKSELDLKHSNKGDDEGWMSWPGRLHAALKAPVKRYIYEKTLAHLLEGAGNPQNDLVIRGLEARAYQEANRAIFMQDNAVTSAYKALLGSLERGGHPLKAGALKILLPIVRVPSNLLGESLQYVHGLPTGLIKAARAYKTGIESLKPEEADMILRDLKKGSIGSALMLLGFFAAGSVGGYYNADDKRKSGDIKPGGFRIFGQDIPSFLVHAPIFEAMNMGATLRRSLDAKQNIGDAALAGAFGLAEHSPFINEMFRVGALKNAKSRGEFFGEIAKSNIEPTALQKAAEWTDRTPEGDVRKIKPETFGQEMASGIPGLRQSVPTKVEKPLSGTGIMLPFSLDLSAPRKTDLQKHNPSLTDAKFKQYADVRAASMRQRLQGTLSHIRQMGEDDARHAVSEITRDSSNYAKQRVGLR